MLTMVQVRTISGTLLNLPLEDASDGLILIDVDGLDPVKATIVSSSSAQQDGTKEESSKRESRNIKLKVSLEPDYAVDSVRGLRNRLYNFFMPKRHISLRFLDPDFPDVDISGTVESCESSIFSKDPEVDISILCFDPDFVDLTPVELSGMSTSGSTETVVAYDGTVETGIQFVLHVNRTLTEFTFYHRPPDGTLRSMDFAAALVAGDVLTVNTVTGSKEITLTRAGSNTSLLYAKSPQSGWIELDQGDNHIRIYAEGAAIPYNITYINRYGGL